MEKIWNKRLDELAPQYGWVADMYDVPQSPVHHAEGNVAVHTQMVLDALTVQEAYQKMSRQDQQVLWMSALLHDVEKRSTTIKDENGNIVSPGHAKKGALTAREILYTQFSVPFEAREQTVHLVRHHGLPLWLMEKPDPQYSLIQASFSARMKWVHMLATADVAGRYCDDKEVLFEKLAFFEAYCREQKVWDQPYPFSDARTMFHYCNVSRQNGPDYVPFEQPQSQVTIVCGLPGMGKDFYIQRNCKDIPVISLDEIRRRHRLKATDRSANGWVAQQAKEMAREYLRQKTDFIWNATCITRQMRSQLVDLFKSYNARIQIVYIEKPYHQWQKQNQSREAMVPPAVLQKMLHKLEVPEKNEAYDVKYVPG